MPTSPLPDHFHDAARRASGRHAPKHDADTTEENIATRFLNIFEVSETADCRPQYAVARLAAIARGQVLAAPGMQYFTAPTASGHIY
jgi:hypothetical protein